MRYTFDIEEVQRKVYTYVIDVPSDSIAEKLVDKICTSSAIDTDEVDEIISEYAIPFNKGCIMTNKNLETRNTTVEQYWMEAYE